MIICNDNIIVLRNLNYCYNISKLIDLIGKAIFKKIVIT